jgi:hypothetical protein
MVRKLEEQTAFDLEFHDDVFFLQKYWDDLYFLIVEKNNGDKEKAANAATKLLKCFCDRSKDKELFTIKWTAILKRAGTNNGKLIEELLKDYRCFYKESSEYKHLKSKEVWSEMHKVCNKFLDTKRE